MEVPQVAEQLEATTEDVFCRHVRQIGRGNLEAHRNHISARTALREDVDMHLHPASGAESVGHEELVARAIAIFGAALMGMRFTLTELSDAAPVFAADVRAVIRNTIPLSQPSTPA